VVTVSHKERGARGRARQSWRLDEATARSGARAAPEEGDDGWGPPISQARREVKLARGKTFSRVGGGNPAGHHRRAVSWAERARWAGREAEAQCGGGESNGQLKRKKKNGSRLG
jgi:hypothetical protein